MRKRSSVQLIAAATGLRRHVDDRAARLVLDHVLQHGLHHKERGLDVHREHLVVHVFAAFEQRRHVEDRRVVVQHLNRTELGDALGNDALTLGRLGQIGAHIEHLPRVLRGEFLHGLRRLRGEIDDRAQRAFTQERRGNRSTDAAAGAGQNRVTLVQSTYRGGAHFQDSCSG
mgnify:CR=1 FL=1